MDIPTELTIKTGWDEIEKDLSRKQSKQGDSGKLAALRATYYAGATHMLLIILEAAEHFKTDEAQTEYFAALRREILANTATELEDTLQPTTQTQ